MDADVTRAGRDGDGPHREPCGQADATTRHATPLLGSGEPPPCERLVFGAASQLVLCCDHASNRVPAALQCLGLGHNELASHIAWDIGAGALTRQLTAALSAAAILANYSRLVVDCNRDPGGPEAFLAVSDRHAVPGNAGLKAAGRTARADAIFLPYHAAIEAELVVRTRANVIPALVSIHSFTPQLRGQPRHSIDVGVLWNKDRRIARPLLQALRAEGDLVVGDNQPYSGRHAGNYTIQRHAEKRGLAHVILEIRQDLVADAAGQTTWCRRLADIFRGIFMDRSIFETRRPDHGHA